MSPSSCKILRTVDSATPKAANRFNTSLMRLVPYSGWSCFIALTASRFGSPSLLPAPPGGT